jgi:hypothetical protein
MAMLGEGYKNHTPVFRGRSTLDQVIGFQPVYKTYCTMVVNLQAFSQFTDGDLFTSRESNDCQQGLVLLGS